MDATRAREAFGLVEEAQELWTRCADMLRAQVSEAVWLTTFNGAEAMKLLDHTLVLSVPSTVVKDRIEVRYLTLVRSALADAGAQRARPRHRGPHVEGESHRLGHRSI